MTTTLPVQPTNPAPVSDARDLQECTPDVNDNSAAMTQANDLLLQACRTRDAAYNHLADNPEDAQEAEDAVALALKTLADLQAAKRSGQGGQSANIAQLLSTLTNTVTAASNHVADHEAGSESSTTKRLLIHTSPQEQQAARKRPISYCPPRKPNCPVVRDADDEREQPKGSFMRTVRSTAVGSWAMDTVDGAVDTGRKVVRRVSRVVRDTTEAVVTTGTGAIGGVGEEFGELGNDLSRRAGTAQRLSSRAIDAVGRGDWDTATRTGGVIVDATVRNLREAPGRAAKSAEDIADHARDGWAMRDHYGKELNGVIGVFSYYHLFDTDRDGKTELFEVRDALAKRGIKLDLNGDGEITAPEAKQALIRAHLIRG